MKIADDAEFAWDFESHLGMLSGVTKLNRLSTLWFDAPPAMKDRAYAALQQSLLQSNSTGYLQRLPEEVSRIVNSDPSVIAWKSDTDSRMNDVLAILEQDLNMAKSSVLKESIRAAYYEAGIHLISWGRLEDALKHLLKSREFTSQNAHHIAVNLRMIACYLDLGQGINAGGFSSKLIDLAQSSDPLTMQRAIALNGLMHLNERNYSLSAQRFTQITGDIGEDWNFVLSAADIGIYAAVAVLMTPGYTITQIREKLLENKVLSSLYLTRFHPQLHTFLVEVLEQHNYRNMLSFLGWLQVRLKVDVHLHGQASDIIQSIQQRLIAFYLQPFSVLDLSRMAQDFAVEDDLPRLRKALVSLAASDKIRVRIDFSTNRIFHPDHVQNNSQLHNQKKKSQAQVLAWQQLQETQLLHLKRALLLLNVRKQGLIVEAPVQQTSGSSGVGGPGRVSAAAAKKLGWRGGRSGARHEPQGDEEGWEAADDREDDEEMMEGNIDNSYSSSQQQQHHTSSTPAEYYEEGRPEGEDETM